MSSSRESTAPSAGAFFSIAPSAPRQLEPVDARQLADGWQRRLLEVPPADEGIPHQLLQQLPRGRGRWPASWGGVSRRGPGRQPRPGQIPMPATSAVSALRDAHLPPPRLVQHRRDQPGRRPAGRCRPPRDDLALIVGRAGAGKTTAAGAREPGLRVSFRPTSWAGWWGARGRPGAPRRPCGAGRPRRRRTRKPRR